MSETNKRGGEAIPVDIRARALVFVWGVAGLVDVSLLACVPPPPTECTTTLPMLPAY